ncbi:MAG: DUF937 domain-containing protein [Oscillospiraceae bacterium]|nr:DUF937 domain-containing protein [Oscillospiraceae bacterium]
MNLLGIIIKSLLSGSTLSTLMKKTGLSSKQLRKLIPLAIPLLIKMMTRNASSQDGLTSLLGALTQHTNKKPMAVQVAEADTEDGDKIIGHILGSDKDSSVISLANQSGLSQQQVSGVLSNIAPALLSGLSAATATGSNSGKVDLSDGLDLSEVMLMLGGSKPQSSGLFGGLFSSKPKEEKDANLNGSALLQLLLAGK